MTEPSPPADSYYALALQVTCRAVNALEAAAARARMGETLDRLERQIAASKAFIGSDVKLVVLPEYFLTGFPMGEPIPAWAEKAALALDGPEIERLAETCSKLDIYLSGSCCWQIKRTSTPRTLWESHLFTRPRGRVTRRWPRF